MDAAIAINQLPHFIELVYITNTVVLKLLIEFSILAQSQIPQYLHRGHLLKLISKTMLVTPWIRPFKHIG